MAHRDESDSCLEMSEIGGQADSRPKRDRRDWPAADI